MIESLSRSIEAFASASLSHPSLAIPAYVLAGLASSLFPCVYPLIPITVGFLRDRNGPGEARWKHPLLYWAGTMLAYLSLGLIAAIGGGAFNTWMQNGFVIVGFGFLFLFLTFVTVDWFPLSFQTGDRLMRKASSHSGAAFTVLMGCAAGFVASACVAPALVAMLLFIAKASAETGTAIHSIAYGGLLSACFGIGIGIPFFLAGVLGTRLPASGRWMTVIKMSFGLLIFLYALYELHKGFLVLGLSTMNIYLIIAGIVLALLAVALGLKPPEQSNRRLQTRFFFALLSIAFSIGLIVRGIADPNTTATINVDGDAAQHEIIAGLRFYRNEDYALELARLENRPVFVDFYADWCVNCKEFYELVEERPELKAALAEAVVLKITDEDPVFAKYEANPNYEELRYGLPFFLVLTPNGEFVWKTQNYQDSTGMIEAIHSAGGSI